MREVIGKNENREKLDFYTTDPRCVEDIIERERIWNCDILENSAGNGHIAKELTKLNDVYTIDIIQRDYPLDLIQDFLKN